LELFDPSPVDRCKEKIMKNLILSLMAVSSLAVAAPALAYPGDGARDTYSTASYPDFGPMYQRILQDIDRGVSEGVYKRFQGPRFHHDLESIRARAAMEARTGHYDPRDINARLEGLRQRMRDAEQHGHERMMRDHPASGHSDHDGGHPAGPGHY
jgi:hypothetical protein